MRIETKPWAGGLLAALLYLVFCVWAVLLGSCAHPTPPAHPRSPKDAARTAVAIETECGTGSGVLYDARHILTARHVVMCDAAAAKRITVTLVNGVTFDAKADTLDATRDLARLRVPLSLATNTLTVARTTPGQVVCAVTATPAREFHCGLVDDFERPRNEGDITIRGAQLWFGNSGSALYNTEGALVGIVVRMYFCDEIDELLWELAGLKPAKTCGGRASSVEGPVLP